MNRPALQALRDQAEAMMRRSETVGAPVPMAKLRDLLDALLAPDDAQERAFIAAQEARDPRVSGSA